MTQMGRSERACGYVLSCRDYGESDRIVTFFTGDKGKLKGIAKNARKSSRRFSNSIELFCYSSFLFSRRRPDSLFLIENCDVIDHHQRIRDDIEKTLAAFYFIELSDLFSAEEKPGPLLFDHLKLFLDLLEKGPFSQSLMRLFELRLLRLSGYDPALERCTGCGAVPGRDDSVLFIIEDGGLRCRRCRNSLTGGIVLSAGTVRTLIAGKHLSPDRLRRLAFSPRALRESDEILTRLIRHILGREPQSLRVFRDVALLDQRKEFFPD